MRDSTFAWPTWAWAALQSRNGKIKAFDAYYGKLRKAAKAKE
jgi:hypothetical protein